MLTNTQALFGQGLEAISAARMFAAQVEVLDKDQLLRLTALAVKHATDLKEAARQEHRVIGWGHRDGRRLEDPRWSELVATLGVGRLALKRLLDGELANPQSPISILMVDQLVRGELDPEGTHEPPYDINILMEPPGEFSLQYPVELTPNVPMPRAPKD